MPTIGLFGTCGGSKWRESFKARYAQEEIESYDPQRPDWKPEDAEIEAEHLANDEILLFPVTSETYATGSLSEVGFSMLQAVRLDERRDFVVLIDDNLDEKLDDAVARKESIRARALVKQHLKKLRFKNVYLVETLEEMLELSVALYRAVEIRESLSRYNPQG